MEKEIELFYLRRQRCLAIVERELRANAPLLSDDAIKSMAPIVLKSWQGCREAFEYIEVYDFIATL